MTSEEDPQAVVDAAPQWSRPRIGRMTRVLLCTASRKQAAAMEPAEDRPDDMNAFAAAKQAGMQPQWSRPRIGRMTPDASATASFRVTCRNGAGRGSAG